jgi:uncharacterized integral membrane protein (TIGR00698 family)
VGSHNASVLKKILFVAVMVVTVAGWLTPPLALACGIGLGLLKFNAFEEQSGAWAKWLLQGSVVALGFGMNFGEVARVGRDGFLYTAISIAFAIAAGVLLGRFLKVPAKAGFLITAGTAICGGSAIAAIAPITKPSREELGMSLGTVFTLNSVALFLFPAVGAALRLTQSQFGLWAALAIHDTSSVVGASAKFGAQALAIGTIVKLTRALWIIPVAMVVSWMAGSSKKVQVPWFILLFCAAAVLNSWIGANWFTGISAVGHHALAVTLFLIGSGISVESIRRAGLRVMLQGVLLWALVAGVSLAAIRAGWIHL